MNEIHSSKKKLDILREQLLYVRMMKHGCIVMQTYTLAQQRTNGA